MKTLFTALRAAIFAAGFTLLWGWVALSLHHRYDSMSGLALPAWTRIFGIVLMVAGGTLGLVCVATFVIRGEGTAAPFDPPRKFVAVGNRLELLKLRKVAGLFAKANAKDSTGI